MSCTLLPSNAAAASAWPRPRSKPVQSASRPPSPVPPPEAPGVEKDDAPPGYHTERRYRAALFLPGILVTLVGAPILGKGLSSSADRDDDIRRAREEGPSSYERVVREHEFDGVATWIGLGHLGVGAALITACILFPRREYVANRAGLSFVPMVGADHAGGTLTLAF